MVDRKFISWSNNAQIWIPQGWGAHYFRETFVLPICPEPVSGRSLRTFFSQPQCWRQLIKHYHHMGFYVHDSWSNNNSCPKKSFISRHHIRSHSQLLVFPKAFIFSFTFLLSCVMVPSVPPNTTLSTVVNQQHKNGPGSIILDLVYPFPSFTTFLT